jgi:simple sugar transport system ATP-binding protein
MIPLMSVTRNFFMGREPTKGRGLAKRFDVTRANEVTMEEMRKMGINLRGPDQAVGTLSGGERQTVAIARAVYFGARVLILDEPTSALGVRQTSNVLATIDKVRKQGVGVVFISHNVRHALAVGDRFTVLNRGKTLGTAKRGEITPEQLQDLMAGGQEMAQLEGSLGGTV